MRAMLPAPTARLVFRTWQDDDLPFALHLFGDPVITGLVGGPFDDARVRARLAAEMATERTHGIQYWPIATHAGALVGCCGLRPYSAGMHELGFYLVREVWGQGLAVEAARSVIAATFADPATVGVFAGHHPDNTASKRALEKLGFRYVRHELYEPTNEMHPCYELRRS